MRTYATAQHIGTRSHQCDAAAVRTAPNGTRAYAVLDGIGSTSTIRDWTRRAARQVAASAARHGDAEAGLRAVYDRYASDPARLDPFNDGMHPTAAAIVAVETPGRPLTIAWCGDARAYLLHEDTAKRLTEDHNLRRVWPGTDEFPQSGSRNIITSYLGGTASDEESWRHNGHPAIETTTLSLASAYRLLLASDGAYEPHEDIGCSLYHQVNDERLTGAVRTLVGNAVSTAEASSRRGNADNAIAIVARITP